MKEKLKELLHRRKRSSVPSSPRTSYEQSEPNSPRSPRTTQHPDSHANDSPQAGRNRPLSSGHADGRASHSTALKNPNINHSHTNPTELNDFAADDYRSYLPVLSPVEDSNDEKILGNARQPIAGEGDGRYEEDVANRNIDRYGSSLDAGRSKPLPEVPAPLVTGRGNRNEQPTGTGPVGSTIRAVPSSTSHAKDYESGLVDRTKPHIEVSTHERSGLSAQPPYNGSLAHQSKRPEGNEPLGSSSRGLDSHQDVAAQVPAKFTHHDRHAMGSGQDWKKEQKAMLEGVVNLKNTEDTDTDVQVAPAVTHEIIKPHEHEVIQQQIHREIHNYTHYHRLQPVLQTEVLPPRHFIPNPNGEGLIEISADELPARTGENRWWDIVQKEPQHPESVHQWRTEPEVIEGKPYITDEGFERRETTIIYPPTLADLSGYSGMVQPVHFDHKTGKRWMGALTTMEKLKQEIHSASDEDFMTMKEVTADLPDVPSSPTVKRKPVDSQLV